MTNRVHNSNETVPEPVPLPVRLLHGDMLVELMAPLMRRHVLFRGADGVILLGQHQCKSYRNGTLIDALEGNGFVQFLNDENLPVFAPATIKPLLYAWIEAQPLPTLGGSVSAECMFFEGSGWRQRPRGLTGNILCEGPSPTTLPRDDEFSHLRTLFAGLRASDAAKQQLQVLLCLMVGRAGLPEFPLIMIDARSKNSGKTRTATAMAHVVGSALPVSDRGRLNQQAGSVVWKPGPHVLLFDNVNTKLFGELISSGVHGEHLTVEPKYQGMSSVFYPVLLVTMNEGRVEHDLWDKALWITLEGNEGEAAVRFDPDPLTYARQHRQSILADCRHALSRAVVPDRDDVERYDTRFMDWERAYQAVAAVLDYPTRLAPDPGHLRDQLLIDIVNATLSYLETHDTAAKPAAILGLIKSQPKRYQDAHHHLIAPGWPPSRQELCLWTLLSPLFGIPLTIEGSCVTLTRKDMTIEKEAP